MRFQMFALMISWVASAPAFANEGFGFSINSFDVKANPAFATHELCNAYLHDFKESMVACPGAFVWACGAGDDGQIRPRFEGTCWTTEDEFSLSLAQLQAIKATFAQGLPGSHMTIFRKAKISVAVTIDNRPDQTVPDPANVMAVQHESPGMTFSQHQEHCSFAGPMDEAIRGFSATWLTGAERMALASFYSSTSTQFAGASCTYSAFEDIETEVYVKGSMSWGGGMNINCKSSGQLCEGALRQ